MRFVVKRATGQVCTTATWMRRFVKQHPDYEHDSVSYCNSDTFVSTVPPLYPQYHLCIHSTTFVSTVPPLYPQYHLCIHALHAHEDDGN
jgi:hypothetical protein